jgi:NAD(P)-dependent dehydrogenase (short-subunit alcohol dehydrogenase family)
VSSDASVNAYSTWGAYSVSKAALDHLARLWAAELDEVGVRVFSVDPGEMNTDMHRDAMPDANPAELANPSDIAERIVRMIEGATDIPNGSRLEAAKWRGGRGARELHEAPPKEAS